MNSLRLLVATALCAWLILPSQSLAQCMDTFELTVTLVTDDYANETSWTITDDVGNVILQNGNLSDFTTYTESICVSAGCYTFTITDSFGDGICCNYGDGSYSISADGIFIANGGDFNAIETQNFCLELPCTEESARNYDPAAEQINPILENCLYPEDLFGPGYDCDGQCINDEDGDNICDEVDPCIGEFDACGVCNGPGEIYECGCYDIPEDDCDCEGNQLDVLGVCGGECTADADQDGICDACDQDGYWIDVQTYAVHTEGDLAGQTTYRVYVVCEAPTDLLYRIAGSGLQPWVIESSTGMWFNSPDNESWNASGMVAEEFGASPLLEYDSFLTLGAETSDQEPSPFVPFFNAGNAPWSEFLPGGGNNVLMATGSMQYGTVPSTDQVGIHPGFAGDDNRVLVMQITTAGDISGQMNVTVYPDGNAASAQTNLVTFDSTSPCFSLDDCVFDNDQDGICDNLDDCVGEYDECGVCNGPGATLACGCTEVPEGDCDCDGNQLDAVGVCGGDCMEDLDADGICDDVDDCIGVVDACGICNGPGEIYECGCADIPEGDCDCNGNQLDALDVCGGTCAEDLDNDGICDDVDDCVGEVDADGICNSVPGCTDATACNYDSEANTDDGSCLQLDCAGECGGTSVIDACGVCGGPGEIYECGCSDVPEGDCDCAGNQLDACGECGGPGDIYSCGCFDQPEGDCDCDGNQLDAIGVCGGTCPSDNNDNGICDNVEFGCPDPEACNFISADLIDDGSCEYPAQYYNCDGDCINDENNNDICDELDLEGCMQDFSCNFNPEATIPDTSCIYPGDDCDDNDPETVNDEVTEDCGCEGEIPEPDGIDALTQWGIEMYPSPVQDVLRIQFRGEAHGATTFTMTSMSGQTVRSRTLQSDATVDVSDLASGVYFATFEGTWGKATRRVMVASGR